MKTYEYGRIAQLANKLALAGVDRDIIEKIMAGGEKIKNTAKPEQKADWMRVAMQRMDDLLDESTRRAVRESCACCLGGLRLKMSKAIAAEHPDLNDVVKTANETKLVFGHSVTLMDDGRILVCFQPEDLESYKCVCLPKAKDPISVTYCYCCGGHVKHHLQTALGRKVSCEVRSSALASSGKSPCSFVFTLEA